MAFPWAAAAMLASSALSAGSGVYGSKQAANAQRRGGAAAIQEQRRQYNIGLNMLEPSRLLGYGATADLARLYGYPTAGYQPVNQLLYGQPTAAGGAVSAAGGQNEWLDPAGIFTAGSANQNWRRANDPLGLFMPGNAPYNAQIDPATGTVDVKGGGPKKDALYTDYLRTGVWSGGKGGRGKKVRSAIDALRSQGWSYGEGGGQWEGAIPAQPAGEPGDMSRFFTSPDYTFRRDEGQRDIGNTFAARGGAASGNALRALTGFNQNLASGEYNNYVARLMQMAGLGQAATTTGVQAGQAAANNIGNALMAQGDARASGYMGAANSIASGVNSGLNAWLWNRYLNQTPQAAPTSSYSQYGPWADAYRFGG